MVCKWVWLIIYLLSSSSILAKVTRPQDKTKNTIHTKIAIYKYTEDYINKQLQITIIM